MATATITATDNNRFNISGKLDFKSVPEVLQQAEQLLDSVEQAIIDCSGVEQSNSAGLALLIELARQMKLKNKTLSFQSLPDEMYVVARAYDIESDLIEQELLSKQTSV